MAPYFAVGFLMILLAVSISAAALPLIGVRINDGARFTNKRTIVVEIKSMKIPDNLVADMQVGTTPDLSDADWQPYQAQKVTLELEAGDGEKRVYVRLRDRAGNVSAIEHHSIVLDTQAPANCRIMLNKGEKFSTDKLGRVLLNAFADEAAQMLLSNAPNFGQSAWENYVHSKKWIIDTNSDGEKKVYARFRDAAGNESETVSASILLDTRPTEQGTLIINGGEKFTRTPSVKVEMKAEGAARIGLVSKDRSELVAYTPDENGAMHMRWEFDSVQGIKMLRAYFIDEAGNKSTTPAEATVIYKSQGPPPPTIVLNAGQQYTNEPNGKVDIKIVPRSNAQGFMMLLGTSPDFKDARPIPFSNSIDDWPLPAETDGLKTVYLKLFDEAKNPSPTASAEIILDRSAPKVTGLSVNEGAEWVRDLSVNLHADVQDAAYAQYSNTGNISPNQQWEPFSALRNGWALSPGDGKKTIFARYKDEAGNATPVVSTTVMLDTKPPEGGIKINGGAAFTNHAEAKVTLHIHFDQDAVGMQISNNPDIGQVKLQPALAQLEDWQLEGEDGSKTVFLRFQDKAGNPSKVYTATILLKRTPPEEMEVVVNNNEQWVRNRNGKMAIALRAEGASHVMISGSPTFEGAEWMPYKAMVGWTLKDAEGKQDIFIRFRDAAGNVSEAIQKSVMLDYAPPVVKKITINNGAQYTNDVQKKVTLNFDVEGARQMIVSNATFVQLDTTAVSLAWEPYQNSKDWVLSGEDGIKTVYALFRDEAGNVTRENGAKIILDRVPPAEANLSINKGARYATDASGKCQLHLSASGADEMMLSNSPNFEDAHWIKFITVKDDWLLDVRGTEAAVFARFRDAAGNESETVSTSIQVDIHPPAQPAVSIDDGSPFVTQRDGKIVLQLSAEGATRMRISRFDHFRDTNWEPYTDRKEVMLAEPDGDKQYFVQFADEAGNTTETISATITLDTTAPTIDGFVIDGDAEWSNHPEKKVKLSVRAHHAAEMMISESATFENAAWQAFQGMIPDFTLSGDDGEKTLYIQLRDEAGNISQPAFDKIKLKRSF